MSYKSPDLAQHAHTPLADAKRSYTRAKQHQDRVHYRNGVRAAVAQQRVEETAARLREAARAEAEKAPELTPEKRAQLAALMREGT